MPKSKSDADDRAAEAGHAADPAPQPAAQPQPPAAAGGEPTVHVEGGCRRAARR
jgi:hypothetical protein